MSDRLAAERDDQLLGLLAELDGRVHSTVAIVFTGLASTTGC